MGSNQSKPDDYSTHSTSMRKPTAYCGFLGRARHTQLYYNKEVLQINGIAIGKLIVELCGNEGFHHILSEEGQATLRFLRAVNSFIPDAEDDGADLRNTAFILRQPGQELVIRSGRGDWEYDFCEDANGQIYGRCVRKPFRRYMWDKFRQAVVRLGGAIRILTGPTLQALSWYM